VYHASEKASGHQVALKIVKKKLLDQYDFYSQMKKELELQFRLSMHPNIVKMYGCFYDDQYVYSVLEFIPEGNLYQKLKKEKLFNDKVAR
jgi:aurora kinase